MSFPGCPGRNSWLPRVVLRQPCGRLSTPLIFPLRFAAACPGGRTGPDCALCSSDAGCAASGGGSATTCSTSLAFAPTSRLKSWSCALPANNPIAALLEPGSLLLQCSTGLDGTATLPTAEQAAAGAPAPAGNCSISFRLAMASNKLQVACAASNCTLRAGQASLACSSTACGCASDPTCGGDGERGRGQEGRRFRQQGPFRGGHTGVGGPAGAAGSVCRTILLPAVRAGCLLWLPDPGWHLAERLHPSIPAAATIAGIASSVNGAASLTCDAGGACNMKLSPLLDANATCTSAECLAGPAPGGWV